MLVSIVYAFARLLLDLLLVRSRPGLARDVELLALRHEVRVLRRHAKRARYQPGDRLVLAGLSRLLPLWGRKTPLGQLERVPGMMSGPCSNIGSSSSAWSAPRFAAGRTSWPRTSSCASSSQP